MNEKLLLELLTPATLGWVFATIVSTIMIAWAAHAVNKNGMREGIDALGGRKFLAFMTVTIMATVGVATGTIEDGAWSTVLVAAIWAYMAGDVGEKVANKTQFNIGKPPEPPAPTPPSIMGGGL